MMLNQGVITQDQIAWTFLQLKTLHQYWHAYVKTVFLAVGTVYTSDPQTEVKVSMHSTFFELNVTSISLR